MATRESDVGTAPAPEALEQLQLDERVGCVAVYTGEPQNCLDGFADDPRCLFFAQGHWDARRKEWTVDPDDLAAARTLHERLSALAARRSAPPEPEGCICAAVRMDDGYVIRGHRHDSAIECSACGHKFTPPAEAPKET